MFGVFICCGQSDCILASIDFSREVIIMYTLYVNTVRIGSCQTLSYTLLTYAQILARESGGIWCICNECNEIVAGNVSE
jgi:hypothetical protein